MRWYLAPYLTVESSRTEQSRVQDVCPVGGSDHNDTCTTHSTPHTMQTMVAQSVNMAVSQVISHGVLHTQLHSLKPHSQPAVPAPTCQRAAAASRRATAPRDSCASSHTPELSPVLPSNPSISVSSWLSVCSRSSLPPPIPGTHTGANMQQHTRQHTVRQAVIKQ